MTHPVTDKPTGGPRPASRVATVVGAAAAEVAAGRPVVVLQNDGFGELLLSAGKARLESVAFVVRYSSGLLFVALPAQECDRLELPRMWHWRSPLPPGHEYAVTVDASSGIDTGISALDRAETARRLADSRSEPADFTRPGHMLPIRVSEDALGAGLSIPAAALLMMRIAGQSPAAILSPLVGIGDPTRLADATESSAFAATHNLFVVSVRDIVAAANDR
jgi:3,4-dihydroxy 2-butanone 4-phosphate synthase/GTP cyclohydrolase II